MPFPLRAPSLDRSRLGRHLRTPAHPHRRHRQQRCPDQRPGRSLDRSPSPRLRRENRIRTIHSSLAIKNNTLTLDQVTAVLDGKRVLAPPMDIREVQNAYEAYKALSSLDPTSIDNLLRAHGFMMDGLVKDAGRFRNGNVGVFDDDQLVHPGTPAHYVPEVIAQLFDWLRTSSQHPLVKSCTSHYELEFIHPFSDGNDRMGRLWNSLILREWHPLFAWLPVESLVQERQGQYYEALARADAVGEGTFFVEFMLATIAEALREAISDQAKPENEQVNLRQRQLLEALRANPHLAYAQAAELIGASYATARRDLARLRELGLVRREGSDKARAWRVAR